jgi:hypothetical protein
MLRNACRMRCLPADDALASVDLVLMLSTATKSVRTGRSW